MVRLRAQATESQRRCDCKHSRTTAPRSLADACCWLLAVALATTGCFEDSYRCTSDAQCDLGEGGRCEIDGRCTRYDVTCGTGRRYEPHAGELTGTCFDDRAVPANVCIGGQPPAKPEGCIADVCSRVPACCEMAWTDACTQLAQQVCSVSCDTRLGITAIRGMTSESYEARWDGTAWTTIARTDVTDPLSWVAPPPGDVEPRLASTGPGRLAIGETVLEVPAGRSYEAIAAIGFDRDGRDTVAASFNVAEPTTRHFIEIWKLGEIPAVRELTVPASAGMVWGDENRDSFPDAIVKAGASYSFLDNVATSDGARSLSNQTLANTSGGATPGAPGMRSLDWLDLNGDGKLDLAAFGASVRVHTKADDLNDVAQLELDCDPPSKARSCSSDPEPNLEGTSFAGCALPTLDDPQLVIAPFPNRKLYRMRSDGGVERIAFPGDSCKCVENCNANQCPGANCTCNYDCQQCAPILALVTRDLDGDRRLDIVAIDAKLQLYTGLAAESFAFGMPVALVRPLPMNFVNVNVSIGGAPRP
ncbi:MAG: hypothetical protein HOV81_01595 [Kofleriaceae bacterium]|nr:hypothetical protein [Kofleriaceae bacterium]